MSHWKEKFSQVSDIREYCVVINTNSKPEDQGECLTVCHFFKI